MSSLNLSKLPSLRKQQLLSEFSGLKQACPSGVFVSLTPGDPSLWSAVLFMREGPYSPAVLRFQILFPSSYPHLPPLITFATDIFHPLITPLTTYMYTTDIHDNGTVSATDAERLPPGGFSLRHGFPEWFGRGRRATLERAMSPTNEPSVHQTPTPMSPDVNTFRLSLQPTTPRQTPSIYTILKYIKSTFGDAEVLDSVPLDAAGNPGAWHAWRTHRRKLGKLSTEKQTPAEPPSTPPAAAVEQVTASPSKLKTNQHAVRKPGEWNWDGVWEDRVKKGISASLSEPVLYGGATATDELIRFLALDESEIESIKDNLQRTLGAST